MPAEAGKLQTPKTLSVHHHPICRPKPARKQQGPEPVGAVRERPGGGLRRQRSEPSQSDGLSQKPHTPPQPCSPTKTVTGYERNPLSRLAGEGQGEGPVRPDGLLSFQFSTRLRRAALKNSTHIRQSIDPQNAGKSPQHAL